MAALLSSMVLLGAIHGVGPDHCLAVATLSASGRAGAVFRVALRFAFGHALILFGFAGLVLLTGRMVPESAARAGEWANGALLILFGAGLLFERLGRVLTLHTHVHSHDGNVHAHLHTHAGAASHDASREPVHQHRHGLAAWSIGAFFALAGIRNLALTVPVALSGQLWTVAFGLAAFALGIVVSMVVYGSALQAVEKVALAAGLSRRALRVTVGVGSAAFGCYWIAIA